jgi:hypothetical protein
LANNKLYPSWEWNSKYGKYWDGTAFHTKDTEHEGASSGFHELCAAIKDMGALFCEDGRYYHAWTLNTAFIDH